MPHHVNIALPIPARRTFTYTVPEDIEVRCGMRALVPFGKRTLTGIIVETDAASLVEAKPVHEILDLVPVFDASMLDFTKWMSDYYLASWGETLHAALPHGMTPESVVSVTLTAPIDEERLREMERHAPKRAALVAALERHKGPIQVSTLQRTLKSDSVAAQLDALEHAGLVSIQREIHGRATAKTQRAVSLSTAIRSDHRQLRSLLDELDSRAPVQARIISVLSVHHLRSDEPMVVAELMTTAKAQASSLRMLIEKGICEEHVVEVRRRGDQPDQDSLAHRDETALPLHPEQRHAVDAIGDALAAAQQKTFLLHGITGSGKTLVYMHALRRVRTLSKSALILVPEISLTPQLIDRFRMTFGDEIAVVHSRMSPGERYDTWRAIARGQVSIVLGVRSALFAPLLSCGLIIVDEEHESSYKQDSPSPRYHARDSAVMRGVLDHAVVILGSATPSMETMYNAQTGKYHLLELHQRSDNAVLPAVRLVDVRDARKRKMMSGAFSHELLSEIRRRIADKEGVLLLQNRRGYSPRLECGDCGHVPTCTQCSVSLTYHKNNNLLRCHYCGSTRPALKSCTECGSAEMAEVGVGTQRAEEELRALLT
ncbi:MAG: primosomal protein N', partial [Candidatus Kapaibacterium sp.]